MLRHAWVAIGFLLLVRSVFASTGPQEDLIKAASRGDTELVASLIKEGVDVNTKNRLTGWTALTAAAYYGHSDTVEALIHAGADVNAKDLYGGTPLMKAVTLGAYGSRSEILAQKARVVKILLEAGADPYARDRWGVAVWQMPIVDDFSELVDIFEEAGIKGVKEERLIQAVERGDVKAVRALIQRGADINGKNEDGQSGWGEAVIWGNLEIMNLMLESGADVNLKLDGGITALMVAAERGNPQWVEKLLKAGADVNAKNEDGATALTVAERNGHKEIAELLRKAGAM